MAKPRPSPADTQPGTDVPAARLHLWEFQPVRDALVIAALIALVWAGYAMRAVTVPLLVALALAYLFEPLVARITRDPRVSRPMAAGGIVLTFGLVVVVSLAILVPLAIGEAISFARDLRQGRFHDPLMKLREQVPADYRDPFDRAIQWLMPGVEVDQEPAPEDGRVAPALPSNSLAESDDAARIREIVRDELAARDRDEPAIAEVPWIKLARGSGEAVASLLAAVLQLGLLAFLIPFYFFFFSVSYPAVLNFGRELIPVSSRPRALDLISKMDRAVAGFVRGRIVISLLIGLMLAIGWSICGVPYAIVLGFVIGIFSMVPYLGGIGIPLAVGFLWIKEMNQPPDEQMSVLWIVGGPVLVFAVMQLVETYILTPVIAGRATNLDPVTILVAVLAGGSIGGVYGMLLAIPVAACAKILLTEVILPRIRAWAQGRASDPLAL